MSRNGEDVSETLEVIPRRWKVIQTVREKVACRDCEKISQPTAPFRAVARGWAGPGLLAMILFEKYGQYQPLNRQLERYGREGVPVSLSILADQVGAAAAVIEPLHHRLAAHVMGAERLHGDDTTVPVLARGKTTTGRIWTYVRDDRPFWWSSPAGAIEMEPGDGVIWVFSLDEKDGVMTFPPSVIEFLRDLIREHRRT